MITKLTVPYLLQVMQDLASQGKTEVSSPDLAAATGASLASVKRYLEHLQAEHLVLRRGSARATRYRLAAAAPAPAAAESTPREAASRSGGPAPAPVGPAWSEQSKALRQKLSVPLAAREPCTYDRGFVDSYEPNKSFLLPEKLAQDLAHLGGMQGQQPAGTYIRKVLEQVLIDLSWSSSRLEGNTYSLLATQELFKSGISSGDIDAVMLLNHKSAIEFLAESAPAVGLTPALVRNLHAVLMRDLLPDTDALGTIRTKLVNISGTSYVPLQVPAVLQEMFEAIIVKARFIKNPVETAFFLWVNLAYLQPFEDGNKRVSRLTANIPLMLYNCAPLSFLDVDAVDYAQAMMGVYEQREVSMAVDLFEWTYRRSAKKYAVVLESMGAPDPVRLRYREALNEAVGLVVQRGRRVPQALAELALEAAAGFPELLVEELKKLEVFNCARYRLPMDATEAWIAAGRPQ